jgi:Putative aminopeptidase
MGLTILRPGRSSINPIDALSCKHEARKEKRVKSGLAVRLAGLALLVATIAGCTGVRVPNAWEPYLEEVRAFEHRIGFTKTATFVEFSEEQGRVPFCGHVSRLYLPYSYEDPAIQWFDVATERECRAHANGADVYFGTVEVLGEAGAAVSPEVLAVQLHRFLYLVIHEDCHEQFEFPYGIEEALCNLLAYRGMARFSEEKYGPGAREYVAIQRYANAETERTRAIKTLYEQLAGYYARYERKEMSVEALLKERARVFGRAEQVLAWRRGSISNVSMANEMTYSRYYPLLAGVYDALGRDLARTVAFFKRVDAIKPSPDEVMKKHDIADKDGVDFIRAYESEIVKTIEAELPEATRRYAVAGK